MVTIAAGKDEVVITLDGGEKFLALKRKISIPVTNITSVSTERAKPSWLSVKMGTHIPRGFMAGTFWMRGGKAFYYVKDFSKCITINLKGQEYSKVVVEVGDKEAVAAKLRNAIA